MVPHFVEAALKKTYNSVMLAAKRSLVFAGLENGIGKH
jgi:hypothetical protein